MRVQRDRKVQQQMDAELIEYHGGIRLSTLWNEKIFALFGVSPSFLFCCLKWGSPDEHGIARFELQNMKNRLEVDGEWYEIEHDDPFHYQDYVVKICSGHLRVHADRYPGFNHYQGRRVDQKDCPRFLYHGTETRDQALSIARTGIDSGSLDHKAKIFSFHKVDSRIPPWYSINSASICC